MPLHPVQTTGLHPETRLLQAGPPHKLRTEISQTIVAPSSPSSAMPSQTDSTTSSSEINVGKRPSPASFSAVYPPAKRSRPSLEPDKENVFGQDASTQLVETQDNEDSGYISLVDKGKGRDVSWMSQTARAQTSSATSTSTARQHEPHIATRLRRESNSFQSADLSPLVSMTHSARTSRTQATVSRRFEFDCTELLSVRFSIP